MQTEQDLEQDTIKLMRECDAGIKMGVSSIDDVFEKVLARSYGNDDDDEEDDDVKIADSSDLVEELGLCHCNFCWLNSLLAT